MCENQRSEGGKCEGERNLTQINVRMCKGKEKKKVSVCQKEKTAGVDIGKR